MPPLPLLPPSRFRNPVPVGVAAPAPALDGSEVAIPVRLPGALRRRIGAVAKRTGRTAAELIAAGVTEYLAVLEARLAKNGGAEADLDPVPAAEPQQRRAAGPLSRVRAQVQAHAHARAQLRQADEAPADPLDRFFAKMSPQEAFERTYSVSSVRPETDTGAGTP